MDIDTFRKLGEAKGIKILHLNTRSILPKMEQLRTCLVSSHIDIITISETWLKRHINSGLLSLPGYSILRQDRDLSKSTKKRGGELLTYIQTATCPSYKPLDKLSISDKHIEAQWTQIIRKHCKNIVICNLYRPPGGDLELALKYLNNAINSVNRNKNDLYILGDFNIDYANKGTASYKKLAFF